MQLVNSLTYGSLFPNKVSENEHFLIFENVAII